MKDIEILENMLDKESSIYKKNKRGNKEIKFEVNSNYYKAIENLLKENENLKQAALKNDDYYKEVCNKNKQLEEQVEYLRRSCDRKEDAMIEAQQECIECEKLCNKNKELEEENKELQKSVEQIYDDYQDAGRLMFEYSEKLAEIKEKLEPIITDLNRDGFVGFADRLTEVVQELLGEEK